jgi:hypothetical protein
VSENIYGVNVTLDLPSGVTVLADANGSVSASVLLAGGAAAGNSLTSAMYTAASGTTPGKVHLALISTTGFSAGHFLAVTCIVAPGVTPTFGSSLLEPGAHVVNANGTDISGATVTLNAVF